MKNVNRAHEELMNLLEQVPSVVEHIESFEVQMGNQILKRRIQLGFTHQDVVDLVSLNGDRITQATISKVESGDQSIHSEMYNTILKALTNKKSH